MIQSRKKRTIARNAILFLGLLSLISGCSKKAGNAPTTPTGEHIIIVDSHVQSVSGKAECDGSSNAPCSTLTEAISVAEGIKSGIPTIWIKTGSYQLGPVAPLEIRTPLILRAEEKQNVEILSEATAFQISASNVTLEGLAIISRNAGQSATVMLDGGQALFKNCNIFNQTDPSSSEGPGLSIGNGGHAILENSDVKTFGANGVEVLNGKLSSRHSQLEGASEAVYVQKKGRASFEDSTFQGSIFVRGGSVAVDQSDTGDIRIADGAYATVSRSTIRGSIDLMRKHAYAEIRDNQIYGRVSAIDAKATIATNKIYGNQQGEGLTAFNYAMLTLTNNSISSMKSALYAHPSSTLILNHNLFNSEVEGVATILCETPVTVTSDGANTLQSADLHISCEGLPSKPGAEQF